MRSIPAFTLVGLLLAASAAAGPEKVRSSATAATQTGDTVQRPVTPTPAPGTTRPGDGQAPIAADAVGSRPVDAAAAAHVLEDIGRSYDQMEKNIELQFAKLMQAAKGDKEALESKIKDLERQIQALKEQAKKIQQVAEKIKQINAQIDSLNKQRGSLRGQIAALDKQIAKLEEDKARALAELRTQKEKAIADAKARDARLIRLPTPTPARKP